MSRLPNCETYLGIPHELFGGVVEQVHLGFGHWNAVVQPGSREALLVLAVRVGARDEGVVGSEKGNALRGERQDLCREESDNNLIIIS